jgi:hypothetical protein
MARGQTSGSLSMARINLEFALITSEGKKREELVEKMLENRTARNRGSLNARTVYHIWCRFSVQDSAKSRLG